jgi:hypothetical protein
VHLLRGDYNVDCSREKIDLRVALGADNVWVAGKAQMPLIREVHLRGSFSFLRLGCFLYALLAYLLKRSNCSLEAGESSWESFLFCVSGAAILYSALKPEASFIRVGQQVRKRASSGPRRLVFLNDGKLNRAQNRPRVL